MCLVYYAQMEMHACMYACMHVCCWSITAILVSASTDGSAQVTQGHGNSIPMKLAYYKSGKKKTPIMANLLSSESST